MKAKKAGTAEPAVGEPAVGEPTGAEIRVLRGNPEPAELAALVAVLGILGRAASVASGGDAGSVRRRAGWLDARRDYRAPSSWVNGSRG